MTLCARFSRSAIVRVLAVPPLAVLLLGPAAPDACAVALNWKTGVSGNAGVASNWQPAQVPGTDDTPTFNVSGSYTVTFDGTCPATSFQLYRNGAVTISTTNHAISNTMRVGDLAGDVGVMTLTTGTMTNAAGIIVANASGTVGVLHVNDDDADLVQTGTAADITVGWSGSGTLNVTNGGLVDAADDIIVGHINNGTVLVSGVHSSPDVRSTLTSSGADGDILVGNAGRGTFTVSTGGYVVASDDLRIALGSSSEGNVTVTGTKLGSVPSTLYVGGDLEIASNTTSSMANGVGTLTVQDTAFVNVTGVTRVGDPNGGTGTLRMRPRGSLSTGSLLVDEAHGVLDFQGGSISVDGGTFDPPGTTISLDDPQFEAVYLKHGAIATFDGGAPLAYSVIVGEAHGGLLRLETGAHLTHVNGVLTLGLAPGSEGELTMLESALLDGAGSLIVGLGGSGELRMQTGADISLTDMNVAYSNGSDGYVIATGTGTTLTMQSMDIGGDGLTAGGSAEVIVGNGGVISTTGPGVVPTRLVHPAASLEIQTGGTFNAFNNFDTRGHIQMSGGQLNVGSLNLSFDADLVGFGTVVGNVAVSGESNVIHAVGGPLTLGQAVSDKGFSNSGTLIVEGTQVTLRDSNGSTLGNVVLQNGTLTLPLGVSSVPSGRTMSGIGNVQGSLMNSGVISPGSSAGTINVQGPFTQALTGRLNMEIGDAATNQFDRLTCTSSVTLGGTLDVQILDGFVPDPGENFTLMTFGSRTGTFSTVTIEGQPVNGQFTIQYNPTSVVLHVNEITTNVPETGTGLPRELAFRGLSGAWSDAAFELAIPEASEVIVQLYTVTGRSVGTLFSGSRDAGVFRMPLRQLSNPPRSGIYLARAIVRTKTAESVRSAKIALLY